MVDTLSEVSEDLDKKIRTSDAIESWEKYAITKDGQKLPPVGVPEEQIYAMHISVMVDVTEHPAYYIASKLDDTLPDSWETIETGTDTVLLYNVYPE